jgi:hypothetical protein
VGGFEQGHFRCLHAHCEHRSDGDFLHEVGYVAADFEVIAAGDGQGGEGAGAEPAPLPAFKRKGDGSILATIENLSMALRRPDVCKVHVAHDRFRDEIMIAPYGGPGEDMHALQWAPFTDADYTRLRIGLERGGFQPIGRESIRDVVLMVAVDNSMDTAIEWLDHRVPEWDGVLRVDTFLTRYFNAADTAYHRAVSRYIWTALAGRVLQPGIKADMVPVMIGRQGTGKSTGVEAIAPSNDHFVGISLDQRDADLARKLRGKLVGELGELKGLNSRDSDSIKQWIVQTHEEWIPKYREFGTKFARRLLMIGTVNRDQFLADEEGEERRWLPVRVGATDLATLVAERDQLWAEGRALFKNNGVLWAEAQRLARAIHGEHRITDPWEQRVFEWLREPGFGDEQSGRARGLEPFTSSELLLSGLGMNAREITRADEMRVGRVLRALGFESKPTRKSGQLLRCWHPTEACGFLHVAGGVNDLL